MIHRPSSRRWFQYSLASLFWLTLVVATAAFAFREHRQRLAVEQQLSRQPIVIWEGVQYFPPGPELKISREAAAMKSYGSRKLRGKVPTAVEPRAVSVTQDGG
jgi:hypothetical protein